MAMWCIDEAVSVCKNAYRKAHSFFDGNVPFLSGRVDIHVATLSGEDTYVEAIVEWRILDVKRALETEMGTLVREQRLIFDTRELKDDELVGQLAKSKSIRLALVRREPVQSEWLERVSEPEGAKSLRDAPEWIRGNAEVVLAASRHDFRCLSYASKELWSDKEFALIAVEKNWRVWLDSLSPELQIDREIVLVVVSNHARALRYLPAWLLKDAEVVLAAMQPVLLPEPTLLLRQVYGTLMAVMDEHLVFVFQHAAPALRQDREFLLKGMERGWHTFRFASPELWADRVFVLSAMRMDGLALEKAHASLKVDREIVLVAVAQNACALEHADEALRSDRELIRLSTQSRNGASGRGVVTECPGRSSRSPDSEAGQLTRAFHHDPLFVIEFLFLMFIAHLVLYF